MKPLSIIAMGGGVNTTALLIKYWERYDHVIFADTGDEMPETYAYIEKYLKPFCKEKGLNWITAKHKSGLNLRTYMMNKNSAPNRHKRECTKEFKIMPIRYEVRKLGAHMYNPAYIAIGFAIDESLRVNTNPIYDVSYMKNEYPLIDDHITRKGCIEIIQKHGWELPIKSGCYYCPFKSKRAMRDLYAQYPDLFQKAVELESNHVYYPRFKFYDQPLISITKNQTLGNWLDDTEDQSCSSGHCMQ